MMTQEQTITIIEVQDTLDLYEHYYGQTNLQPAYLELEGSELRAGYNPEIGNAVPEYAWNRRALRWTIPPLTAYAANALMRDLLPLMERVAAGYTIEWDGSNNVGRLTPGAEDASEAVQRQIDDTEWGEQDVICEVDASEWASNNAGLGLITATTTDAELDELIADDEAQLGDNEIADFHDTYYARREQLRDA